MMNDNLTNEERIKRNEEMIALYKKGNTSLAKLGKQFGLTRQAVSLIFKEYKVPVSRPTSIPKTEILAYCKDKLDNNETITISDIKEHCNCSVTPAYIGQILMENNIPTSRSENKSLRGTLLERLSTIDTSNKSIVELLDLCKDENNYPSRMTLIRVIKKYNIPYGSKRLHK